MLTTIIGALRELESAQEQLGELDGQVGDGDLGVTIGSGSRAAVDALRQLPADSDLPAVLRAIGGAFGSANPSTFGALIRGALTDGARALGKDAPDTAVGRLHLILDSAIDGIARRGKTSLGDKTVLDAVAASAEAAAGADRIDAGLLDRMAEAATAVTERLQDEEFKRGRAAWVGARGIGVPDPGSVAYIHFLRALARHLAEPNGTHDDGRD